MKLETDLRNFIPKISTKLPNWYSLKAKNQAEEIIKNWINDQAPYRKFVEWITIDDITSQDLDDGIWAEKRKDWGDTIFISIADPTEAITPLSPIDLEAMNKATSFYPNTHTIHMLPIELSTNIISLNHNTIRNTKTIQIDYDSNMEVINTEIYESKFHNKHRFNYSDFWEHILNEWKIFHSELNIMWEIARKLKEKRKWKIKFDFNESDRKLENNFLKKWNTKHIASILIEEFMVAANIEVAKYLIKNQVKGIFRAHMPEYKWKILFWQAERAYYSPKENFHYWLWEEKYMHTTSPIRRLADYLSDRLLKAHLRWNESPYNDEEIKEIINYINLQINSIVLLEREHNYQSKLVYKIRKLQKEKQKFDLSEIKDQIRNWVWKWLLLPKNIKQEIIEKINNWKDSDWHWIITPYLVSRETEIIENLERKIIWKMSPKTFFNIISKSIIERKQESVFKITEKKKKKKDWFEYSISIYFKEEKIINNKWDFRTELYIKRKTIKEIFDYFIERSKRYKKEEQN